MKWTQIAIKVVQQLITQQQRIAIAKEKIKGVTVHAGINVAGGILFAILAIASIIMIFADLGSQWNNLEGTHFSGGIQAALLMLLFGGVIFGSCVLISHLIAKRKAEDLAEFQAQHDFNPLLLFGREFISELKRNFGQPAPRSRRRIERRIERQPPPFHH